jgi:hypothetical protein
MPRPGGRMSACDPGDAQTRGERRARDLGRLLSLKDNAQYGVVIVSRTQAESAVGWAGRLVENARDVVCVRS